MDIFFQGHMQPIMNPYKQENNLEVHVEWLAVIKKSIHFLTL